MGSLPHNDLIFTHTFLAASSPIFSGIIIRGLVFSSEKIWVAVSQMYDSSVESIPTINPWAFRELGRSRGGNLSMNQHHYFGFRRFVGERLYQVADGEGQYGWR